MAAPSSSRALRATLAASLRSPGSGSADRRRSRAAMNSLPIAFVEQPGGHRKILLLPMMGVRDGPPWRPRGPTVPPAPVASRGIASNPHFSGGPPDVPQRMFLVCSCQRTYLRLVSVSHLCTESARGVFNGPGHRVVHGGTAGYLVMREPGIETQDRRRTGRLPVIQGLTVNGIMNLCRNIITTAAATARAGGRGSPPW